ncbi:MAG: translation elongation factor 4 [Planctomycetota bacterium]|jgi:GTP-binding protein LepA
MRPTHIRNFSIIAHIDHGKSTLADRFLLKTGVITEREFREQMLDDMDLERERGITIKANTITLPHTYNGEEYILNLIDTPGHVDFGYEVSRSLTACEGALLLADASQGMEAQTLANAYLAIEAELEILPVINKIDLPMTDIEGVNEEFIQFLGCEESEILKTSAKTGEGVESALDAIIERVPAPQGDPTSAPRALIYDSKYDDYRGVVASIRVVDGTLRKGDKIKMCSTGRSHEITELGIFGKEMESRKELSVGEVGYLIAAIKNINDVRVGDTVTTAGSDVDPLPGYEQPKPMVYCGLYPSASENFENLRKALERLALNDSSFTFEPESSSALGFGFRCGFLGLLHMEIVQERLERESDVDLVQTAPNVTFKVLMTDETLFEVHSPGDVPDPSRIKEYHEPVAKLQIMVPQEHIGAVMTLAEERRATYSGLEYLHGGRRALMTYEVSFAEIVFDFHDKLKSATRGYGTMDYEIIGYRPAKLAKVDVMVHGERVDALSMILPRDVAEKRARRVLIKLRREIPRHLFQVALQAAIGGKVIARENISAMSKNVTAKCYGGDISRKRKLLEKQKEGKKRMKSIGSVTVPQKAFMVVLSREDE